MAHSQFGNKVLRWYQEHGLAVTPVHPTLAAVEGVAAVKSLAELADPQHTSVSVVTPPAVSARVVQEAIALRIPALWFQPGSEPEDALKHAQDAGLLVLAHGYCILRSSDAEVARVRSNL